MLCHPVAKVEADGRLPSRCWNLLGENVSEELFEIFGAANVLVEEHE